MAKKAVKKPVRRRGYAEGGSVDEPSYNDKLLAVTAARKRAPNTAESDRREQAARDAIDSGEYNVQTPGYQKAWDRTNLAFGSRPGKMASGADTQTARADYPGFAKGGKVRKVAPAKKSPAKRKR